MTAILTLLLLLGLVIYVMLFWSPSEGAVNSAATGNVTPGTVSDSTGKSGPARLEIEKKWYGISFRGFQDEYGFSTAHSVEKVAADVRGFFCRRKATVLSEDRHQLLLSRGHWFYRYVGGLDTMVKQEIDVSYQTAGDVTRVLLRYRVPGFHIRIPPNQLRREVLKLQQSLIA